MREVNYSQSRAATVDSGWSSTSEGLPFPDSQWQANSDRDAGRKRTSELLERAKEGSSVAFLALIRPFERTIYIAAFAFAGNHIEAERIAQDTMFLAFNTLSDCSRQEELKTWLIKLAVCVSRQFCTGHEEVSDQGLDEAESWMADDRFHSVTYWACLQKGIANRDEIRKLLSSALGSLPRPYREVLFLKDVLHLTTAQTAEALDLSQELVRRRMSQARFQLCDVLASKSMIDRATAVA